MPYNTPVTRADAAALIPEDVATEIINYLPQQSAVMALGRRLPNMPRAKRRIPILDLLPYAYFVNGDTGLKQTTKVAWKNKYLEAEELAVIVPIPDAVAEDADYDIMAAIRPLITEAFGLKFDRAVFYGEDAPSSWPDDIIAAATAAGNAIDLSTFMGGGTPNGKDLYDAILSEDGLFDLIESDGYAVTGTAANIRMKAKLRGLRDDSGQPILNKVPGQGMAYELDGGPLVFPRNGLFTPDGLDAGTPEPMMISGDFDQLVWSIRTDLTYEIFREGVITDGSGAIVHNLMQQDMKALRAVMRIAWQVPNPINRLRSTESARFPFGVLFK